MTLLISFYSLSASCRLYPACFCAIFQSSDGIMWYISEPTWPRALTLVQHPLVRSERAVKPHCVIQRGRELCPVIRVRQQRRPQERVIRHVRRHTTVQLHVTSSWNTHNIQKYGVKYSHYPKQTQQLFSYSKGRPSDCTLINMTIINSFLIWVELNNNIWLNAMNN